MSRRQSPFSPFVLSKISSFGPPDICVAGLEVNDSYFCLEYRLGESQVVVFAAKKQHFSWTRVDVALKPELERLKSKALQYGATLEAVQLLGALMPLTREEEACMADQKLARKAADTEGLKAAAKKTSVKATAPKPEPKAAAPKAEPAKRKGNPEALAKAREARNGPPVNRVYKVLNKTNGGREGSWTNAMLGHILGAKSTDEANASLAKDRPNKDKKLDFSWAAAKGYIEFAKK